MMMILIISVLYLRSMPRREKNGEWLYGDYQGMWKRRRRQTTAAWCYTRFVANNGMEHKSEEWFD